MKKKLQELTIGSSGKIIGFEKGENDYKSKLLSMGLTKGTNFKVIKKAPLGDPIEIKIRNFNLSLRKNEANILIIEEEINE